MDWVAAGLSLVGTFTAGNRYWWGWAVAGIGSLLWAWIGYQHSIYGQTAINLVLAGVCSINALKWVRKT